MATGIPDAELRRTLQSLALGKARVLNKEPLSKEVADSDSFSANDKFTSKSFRLKIPQLVARDPQPERQAVMELVEDERKGLIEAAIVRVMKSRKMLSHAMLVAEVLVRYFNGIQLDHSRADDETAERAIPGQPGGNQSPH